MRGEGRDRQREEGRECEEGRENSYSQIRRSASVLSFELTISHHLI